MTNQTGGATGDELLCDAGRCLTVVACIRAGQCKAKQTGGAEVERWREIAKKHGEFVGWLTEDKQGEMRSWSEDSVCMAIAEAISTLRQSLADAEAKLAAVDCVVCHAEPKRMFNLRPGVDAEIYFCERCFRCTEHAFDPEMVESRVLLLRRLDELEAKLADMTEDYLRRHKEAADFAIEAAQLKAKLAADTLMPCCQEWETCEYRCVPRATHFKAKLEQAEKEREAMRLDNDGLAKIVFDQKQREAAARLKQHEEDVAALEANGDYRPADFLKSKRPV